MIVAGQFGRWGDDSLQGPLMVSDPIADSLNNVKGEMLNG